MTTLKKFEKRVLMFGGKGGVGKTTASAATALHQASRGYQTLIITNDYTPSLSDIFEVDIGPTETQVPQVDDLFALEIDPDEVRRRWKEEFGDQVYEAACPLVDMPRDEIVDYVAMAPGIQEEFMLNYILERVKRQEYDLVIWDTAPAGDTLRFLKLPQRFLEHLRTAPQIYADMRDTFGLSQTPFTDIIDRWRDLAQEVIDFFTDPENVEFVVVTIPEALGLYQTERVVADLERYGLEIRNMIVNNVIEEPECRFLEQRRESQQPYLSKLEERYGDQLTLFRLPLLPHEVKGIDRLEEVASLLFKGSR